ncbi:hypothetical protein BJ986_001961 [Phycicoccus badiiscoriae]|uniref:Regulator of ribonuclease activity B domain-containing protein n=1 Tax=Pedococcus badiiscoriae TaxID=642776 RepID=A0A852WL35_9MICO|nr:hypothetical protein [Pedococcus badiiscoriae]
MGLFWRNKLASFDTGHAGDDQTLTQLSQMSGLTAPRRWVHYPYFADEAGVREAAGVVAAAGWELQNVAESAAGGPDWVVIAERHGAVTDPDTVREREPSSKASLNSGRAATTTAGKPAPKPVAFGSKSEGVYPPATSHPAATEAHGGQD